jgi:hypothetical protein
MSQVTENKVVAAPVPMTPLQEFWHYFKRNKGAVVGLVYVAVMIIIAVFANFLAPITRRISSATLLAPPFWQDGGSLAHLLGTDDVGRDILSRLMYGARLSLLVGCLVVVLSLILGVVLGLVAGYFGGVVDSSSCASSILCWRCRACCWRWCWWLSSALDRQRLAGADLRRAAALRASDPCGGAGGSEPRLRDRFPRGGRGRDAPDVRQYSS